MLRVETTHVLLVQDLLADPVTATQALSQDGKAWYLPVGVAGTLGDPAAAESVTAVRAIVADAFDGSSTTARVTGPPRPSTFSDQIAEAEHDLLFISIATAGLIALILLIVYRSVFTALLPLLVIGISLAVGRGVLSALGELGMPVSQFTVAFMTAILLGAGTDYTVFLISRYHEQRRAQVAPRSGGGTRHRQHWSRHPGFGRHRRVGVCRHRVRQLERVRRDGAGLRGSRPGRVRRHRHVVAAGAVARRETRHRRTQVRPHPAV